MADRAATERLEQFAGSYHADDLIVKRVVATLDERQDGEPVTRVALLLDDPAGDTWAVEAIRRLRLELGRKARELELPSVSLTLVPESEAETVSEFAP